MCNVYMCVICVIRGSGYIFNVFYYFQFTEMCTAEYKMRCKVFCKLYVL